jgi:hypothetical protein
MTTELQQHEATAHDVASIMHGLRGEPFRRAVEAAEQIILSVPQVELPTKHYFSNGIYAREATLPADTMLTGCIHKKEHLSIIVGDITISDEFNGPQRLTGHLTFWSPAGMKRIIYAHADTIFTTIHPTTETDIDTLEKLLVCKNYAEFERYLMTQQHFEVLP